MTKGLQKALMDHGHNTDIVRFPFNFCSHRFISELMDYCIHQDFESFNGQVIDKVIALQFPAYYVQHPDKTLWLMHQHRTAYDLYDKAKTCRETNALQKKIVAYDNREFAKFFRIFTMCRNISKRLYTFNTIKSTPLYHPPACEERFYCKESYDYIFFPSRLEMLKRQDLLIKAMSYTRSPVMAVIAGEGGQKHHFYQLIEHLHLKNKVCLTGHVGEAEKYRLYARSLAVFFGPYDEDYGYITLEAMLSAKPVITCTDSGGPLEFVVDKETGFVVEPDPMQIAKKIDWLYDNRHKAKQMGEAGKQSYLKKNINWNTVVEQLLQR